MVVKKDKLSSLEDTNGLGSFPPLPTQVTTSVGNAPCNFSYANVTRKPSGKKVNFRTLFTPGGNGIDVVVSVESIRAIGERFANTPYGFFLRKRVAYPVVANNGLDSMLENGSWFICNNPLILKKWHPDVNLLKEDVSTIPVWVKLHDVLVTAFSEDGLSFIATKLGTPLMLDSYTFDMCMQSWGRSSYARAMIELRADMELNDNIVVAMPKITREGHYTCNIRVEYEWKPPRCASCKVFGHIPEECSKNIGVGETKNLKKTSQAPKGILVGPKVGFKPHKEYRHISKKPTANSSGNKKKGVDLTDKVSDSNPFDILNSVDNDVEMGTNGVTSNSDNNRTSSSGLIIDGQAMLVVEAGNPLKKVEYPGDHDSEEKVASVDNDMARSLASERTGFGQHLYEEIQSICDKLDIQVRGARSNRCLLLLPLQFKVSFGSKNHYSYSNEVATIGFDYEVKYKKGVDNVAADALSVVQNEGQLMTTMVVTVPNELFTRIVASWDVDMSLQTLLQLLQSGKLGKKHYTWTNAQLLRKNKLVVGKDEELRMDLLAYFHNSSVGGHSGVKGYTVVFVVVDRLTKYAHFMLLSHPFTAAQVAQEFLDTVYKWHSLPSTIVSYRDKIFLSNCWKEVFKLFQVKLLMKRPKEWKKWLSLAELWYNSNFHTYIQTTPFEAVYGQSPPIHVPYLGGLSKLVDAVDRSLEARGQAIQICNKEGLLEPKPMALLDRKLAKKKNAAVVYGLVQWANGSKEDATWELLEDLYVKFP
ncbi:retrotransposon protein, putative, ty1-copia subclass [Tanacetum coccineum]